MSGLKCGEIRLEDTVRAAVQATYSVSASATSALAAAAAVQAEVAEAVAGAEHVLSTGVDQRHQAALEAFVAEVNDLKAGVAELRERQTAIETARYAEPAMTQETLTEMTRLGRACESSIGRVQTAIAAARRQIEAVQSILRTEERGRAYTTSLRVRLARGLIVDIDERLDSARPGGLRAVKTDALRLRKEVTAAAEAGVDETALQQFRDRLEALTGTASGLETAVYEQRVAHHRLMLAFRDAGYRMAPGSEQIPNDYRSPARSTQLADEWEVTAQTEVHTAGELRVTMLGPAEEGSHLIRCSGRCETDTHKLFEAAKALGLKVTLAPVPTGGEGGEEAERADIRVRPKDIERNA